MDLETAQSWYGGPWYQTDGGGVHPGNDPANPEAQKIVERLREQLGAQIRPGMRALDLGCCAGRFTFAMERLGAAATGIDCVDWALAHARRLARRWNSRCQFVAGDFDHLPFARDSFDLALFPQNIVEVSYPQMERIVEQLTRILAPGGKFCVEMQDWRLRTQARGALDAEYDAWTGIEHRTNQAPGFEAVQVPTWFWTVGFARYVIGRRMTLVHHETTAAGKFWMVFANE